MKIKDVIQPNKLNAPVLFVGVGGIGSKIVKGVSKRCLYDDKKNIRFVIMDTDVNDLLKSDGAGIVAIQTSSTRTVEEYLDTDVDAATKWFPVNKMLDAKPVSEGAGQVRGISRLALNSTIKQGEIFKLYKVIDELFLKDGGGYKQAIRVVVCSTAAGGTGSGIAMEVAMLIRHYVKKTYPAAAAMIRGFLVMPGVMDTVIDTQSERDSLRC
ncbi:MAG: tubulin-like doman-containing protein, partial [Acutalibacteraceae bacterium]